MLTLEQVKEKIKANQGWILLSAFSGTLYELSRVHSQLSDAHNYTAELTKEIIDTIGTGNLTLIEMLIPELNETNAHCTHETKHHQNNADVSYGLSVGAFVGTSALFAWSAWHCYQNYNKGPQTQGYERLSTNNDLGDEDNKTHEKSNCCVS